MKNWMLASAIACTAAQGLAQCTPNPLYQDSVFGVWPDTVEGFISGTVGVFYTDTMNLKVPQDAGEIDPDFAGIMLDSVQFDGVDNLPPGLAIICNSQTTAPCTYLTGVLGCGLIEGIPTMAGTYDLTLNVTAYAFLFGSPFPVPYSFEGYSIVIDGASGVAHLAGPALGSVQNTPNPFTGRTTIEFTLSRAGSATVAIFDLVGERIWTESIEARAGSNKVVFDGTELSDGIYLYKLEAGAETFTGRMVLNR